MAPTPAKPSLLSPTRLESLRREMTEYNFVAQFQQDPQPKQCDPDKERED